MTDKLLSRELGTWPLCDANSHSEKFSPSPQSDHRSLQPSTECRFRAALSVSRILLSFLFAGLWWILFGELAFKVEESHFKLGIELLLMGMGMLAVFGVI
jgi:hypothetical protein